MGKSKIERIASIEEEIKQLKERQKQLKQQHNLQERKDRTKRLCKRMGLLESMLPETIPLTDEQFKAFLEQTVATDSSRRILDGLAAQGIDTTTPPTAEAVEQIAPAPTVNPMETEATNIATPSQETAGTAWGDKWQWEQNRDDGARTAVLSPTLGLYQGRTYTPFRCRAPCRGLLHLSVKKQRWHRHFAKKLLESAENSV